MEESVREKCWDGKGERKAMRIQTQCIRCPTIFWSKAAKSKTGEIFAMRTLCRNCENDIRHDEQIRKNYENAAKKGKKYNPRVRSLEGISERDYLLMGLAQIEMERRTKEKKEKELERQRQRTETN